MCRGLKRHIHRIWLGGGEIPEQFLRWGEKIEELNPECELKLWTEKELKGSGLWRDNLKLERFPLSVQSDFYRGMILKMYGGLYLDMDIEPVKEFPAEFWRYEIVLGVENLHKGMFGSAVIFSEPGSRWTDDFLSGIVANVEAYSGGEVNPPEFSGPGVLTRTVMPLLSRVRVLALGPEYFYPVGYWEKEKLETKSGVTENTYCIHHWCASWSASY